VGIDAAPIVAAAVIAMVNLRNMTFLHDSDARLIVIA
jgi:hypothetical protein